MSLLRKAFQRARELQKAHGAAILHTLHKTVDVEVFYRSNGEDQYDEYIGSLRGLEAVTYEDSLETNELFMVGLEEKVRAYAVIHEKDLHNFYYRRRSMFWEMNQEKLYFSWSKTNEEVRGLYPEDPRS